MATRYIEVWADSGSTVAVRILRVSDEYVYDFNDSSFKSALSAATTPNLTLTENNDAGDVDESLYLNSMDFSNLNEDSNAKLHLFQAIYVPTEIIQNAEVWIEEGRPTEEVQLPSTFQISGSITGPAASGSVSQVSRGGKVSSPSISGNIEI